MNTNYRTSGTCATCHWWLGLAKDPKGYQSGVCQFNPPVVAENAELGKQPSCGQNCRCSCWKARL